MEEKEFRIYGRENCAQCAAAKRFLDSKGVSYRYIDIGEVPEERENMFAEVTEATGSAPRTVPQIFSESFGYIGGFDQLAATYSTLYPSELQG